MTITWQNINTPNFSSSNNLAVAGGDSLVSGIRTLQDAARGEGQRRINQFNTGTERNTADVLNQISNTDANGLDNFNASNLKDTFGDQVDINQVTDAVTGRRNKFTADARLATQDARQLTQDEQNAESHDLDVKAKNLSMEASSAALLANKSLLERQNAQRTTAANFMGRLPEFNSADDVTQEATRYARDNKLGFDEAAALISNASTMWNANIAPTGAQQERIMSVANDGMQHNAQVTKLASDRLDQVAAKYGVNPTLLSYASDPNTELGEVFSEFNDASDGAWLNDSNVNRFKRTFADTMHRNPTASETRYLLSKATADSWYTSGGIDQSQLVKSLSSYKSLTGDNETVNWYKEAKNEINAKSSMYAKGIEGQVKQLTNTARDNRKKAFNKEYDFTPITEQELSARGNLPAKLTNLDWLEPTFKPKAVVNSYIPEANGNQMWPTPK